ncbi:MAG: cardiolipin synthase, partial [Synergistaceae bacterium]|nr:cardiolipin synthase [Synergistaceae bacterium]
MKKNRPLWKKFLAIAASAFVLGLLPYIRQLALTNSPSAGFSAMAAEFLPALSKYVPLIAAAYVASIALLVLFEERNPDRTILWLMTLAFLPIIGIILYMLLGPDMKRIKMRKLFRPTKSYPSTKRLEWKRAPARVRKTSVLAYRNSAADICERCSVEILVDGNETFSAVKRELMGAKRYIDIEYFIFKNDRLGREIADILRERSWAGVRVRMIVDGVGSWKMGHDLKRALREGGVDVRTFMPVSFPFFHSTINFRNHRKIIVVDGDVAFTGGLNVGVEYLGEGPLGRWRDTHALFQGDAVRALNAIFLSDWAICSGENHSPDDPEFAPSPAGAPIPFTPTQIVPGGSGSAWRSIQQMYFLMIAEAQTRIWITTPYLVPDAAIMDALKVAALSGIDVQIIVP